MRREVGVVGCGQKMNESCCRCTHFYQSRVSESGIFEM